MSDPTYQRCLSPARRKAFTCWRQACGLQRFGGRPVNDVALGREHRPWHGAIPRQVGVVPRHRTSLVGAGGGERVRRAAFVSPDGDLLFAVLDGAAAAGLDLVYRVDNRPAVAPASKAFGARRVGL